MEREKRDVGRTKNPLPVGFGRGSSLGLWCGDEGIEASDTAVNTDGLGLYDEESFVAIVNGERMQKINKITEPFLMNQWESCIGYNLRY